MENKKFDGIEMKRKGAELVYKKVESLTKDGQLKFWQTGDEELRKIYELAFAADQRTGINQR